MLFVHYPEVSRDERLARLAPIDWSRCCTFGGSAQAPVQVSRGRHRGPRRNARCCACGPQAASAGHRPRRPASPVHRVPAGDRHGRGAGLSGSTAAGRNGDAGRPRPVDGQRRVQPRPPVLAHPPGRSRGHRRLCLARRRRGDAAHRPRASRVLNWLGAVPHWLYPTILRQDATLWSQVVIWTSLIGTFLTADRPLPGGRRLAAVPRPATVALPRPDDLASPGWGWRPAS